MDAAQPCELHFSHAVACLSMQLPRAWVGDTLAGRWRQLRLDHARQLLSQRRLDSLSVAEVGRRCGYTDASHLGRDFQPDAGLTPLRWRQQQSSNRNPGTWRPDGWRNPAIGAQPGSVDWLPSGKPLQNPFSGDTHDRHLRSCERHLATGEHKEPVAAHLRQRGHTVHCPTLACNRPGGDRATTGLAEAAPSLIDFLNLHDLNGVRLMGHSCGGMVIIHAADRVGHRIRRLVNWIDFVPLGGESHNDLVPPHCVALFDGIAAANNVAVMLPYPIWREAFINDADAALDSQAFGLLNPHPNKTFTDKA